jgi:hypothetical protein
MQHDYQLVRSEIAIHQMRLMAPPQLGLAFLND